MRPADPGARTRRAIVSFAWVAGPPPATLIIGAFGDRAILLAIAAVAVLNVATTAAMLAARSAASAEPPEPTDGTGADVPMSRAGGGLIVVAFIALQATNNAVVSIMSLFVMRAWSTSPGPCSSSGCRC